MSSAPGPDASSPRPSLRSRRSFETLSDTIFQNLDREKRGRLTVGQIKRALRASGLRADDPRLRDFFESLQEYEDDGIDRERFSEAVGGVGLLLERAVSGNLVIPDFASLMENLTKIFDEVKENREGEVASYIPQLARVPADKFGFAVCTIDGQRFALGDAFDQFSLQSTSKPITYCLALEEHGEGKVHEHVGREPSGQSFNEITLDSLRRPHNPMINAGAIMCASLIRPELTPADRFEHVMEVWAKLSGGSRPHFNNSVYLSEKQTADRNFALAYFMRENKSFPPNVDIHATLEFYFQCCSMELSADQVAVVASTLARAGSCPLTGDRVFQPESVKNCLSLMASCGLYDFSGEFAFTIGLPAKSGVGGGLMVVVPNVMGICIWSPRLDSMGNTVRGIEFCKRLVAAYNFHNFDNVIEGNSDKLDPRLRRHASKIENITALCWAASLGDLTEVQQLLVRQVDINQGDYDNRTPLHLAASAGHLDVVRLLLERGASVDVKDRWGRTPLDDALREGHPLVAEDLRFEGSKNGSQEAPGSLSL